jgi:microcystin-dependent protein
MQGFGGSSNQRHINGQFSSLQINGGEEIDLKVSGGAEIKKLRVGSLKTKTFDAQTINAEKIYLSDPIVDSLQGTTKQYVDNFRLVGDIKFSIQSSDHQGWLICDGRSLESSQYPDLYALIGTQFGSVDGDHFTLPDCRGRVLGSAGSGVGLTSRNIGDVVGEETHTMSMTELPSHSHSGTTETNGFHSHSVSDPGHTHTQTTINDDFNSSGGNPPGFVGDSSGSMTWNNINSSTTGIGVIANGEHNHHFNTDLTGNGNSFNVMQPTIFVANVFIFSATF